VSEIDDIRRQMAQIRHDLHQDVSSVVGGVSEVVTEVSEVMDWRSVLRNHPYLLTGTALAVGYLIVPRRKVAAQGNTNYLVSAPAQEPPAPRKRRSGPLSWAINLLWPIATQAAQSYAMIWIENQLKDYLQMGPGRIPPEHEPHGHDLRFRTPGQFR
jgi:hypothetical protein